MTLGDLTESAVNAAIAEFDKLGRAAFLAKYGFGEARSYMVEKDGLFYDSKALAGAAHGFVPGQAPLKESDFRRRSATVGRALSKLGFVVASPSPDDLPKPGDVLTNDEIGSRFAVGNMGGMRRSTVRNLLVIISDAFKGLYVDRWDGNILHYTGMGKVGPQSLDEAQNRTLAASPSTGIPVHLLEAHSLERYTYIGKVVLTGQPYQEIQVDDEGNPREVWMFPLSLESSGKPPVITREQVQAIEVAQERIARKLSDAELKLRAERAPKKPVRRAAGTTAFVRDPAVAGYAKRQANGACDLCLAPAPFTHRQIPYLECHHVVWLSAGGDDAIDNTVALCPNCHRKMHVVDAKADRQTLLARLAKREQAA